MKRNNKKYTMLDAVGIMISLIISISVTHFIHRNDYVDQNKVTKSDTVLSSDVPTNIIVKDKLLDCSYSLKTIDVVCEEMHLDVKIITAIIHSVNSKDPKDIFGMGISSSSIEEQIRYFSTESGLINSNGVVVLPYLTAYVNIYGKNKVTLLYNTYFKLYGINLK